MTFLSKADIQRKRAHYRSHSPQGRACTVSVMDDTDPDIEFDEDGVCNHVHYARRRLAKERLRGPEAVARLEQAVDRIKREGKGKAYDCVLGVSGGVDSTYAAWRAKELGLRPLAVHLDNGWNSDLAVSNIERVLSVLGIDLYTYVVDWEEIKDLQRSVILSGTANLEVVTDHAINATMVRQAARHGIRTIVTGVNVETESMHLGKWHYDNRDAYFIRGLHKRFGSVKLKTYPTISAFDLAWYLFVRRIRTLPVLNYAEYNKEKVSKLLQDELGWQPYAHKHGESIYTRFFQERYLPQKWGFDKRKLHFSTLIVSGQMTRDEALKKLEEPLYEAREEEEELEYVTKKLGFDPTEWSRVMSGERKYFFDYPNRAWMFDYNNPLVQYVRAVGKGERRILGLSPRHQS